MMAAEVTIRLLGPFDLLVDGESTGHIIGRSKKGTRLLQILILYRGAPVPSKRLMALLWPDERSTNPENALKTLISRFRVQLNHFCSGLGQCIAATRGGYQFRMLHHLTVDLLEWENCMEQLDGTEIAKDERYALCRRVMELYGGDPYTGDDPWLVEQCTRMHRRYLRVAHDYLDLIREQGTAEDVRHACQMALEVEPFDERFHVQLMRALVNTNRIDEALAHYKRAAARYAQRMDAQPPQEMQDLYAKLIQAGNVLDMSLDAIRSELREYGKVHGAFECDWSVFRKIYNLQIRNLERLGSTMYLAMIMLSPRMGATVELMEMESLMDSLGDVLRAHLRKGDTITRFAPTQYALLLPTVNMDTGRMVMQRIRSVFKDEHPDALVEFTYRLGPLQDS